MSLGLHTADIISFIAKRERDELRPLKGFVQRAWETVEPGVDLRWNWHLDAICDDLERVTRGELRDVIFNVPPGTMKSYVVSVFWPCWEWMENPTLKYLCASYGQHLSTRDNLNVLKVVKSAWYRRACGLQLSDEQNAKGYFQTKEGGWRLGTSVGGVGTGEHPDRKIIDDPITADQARSVAERSAANSWLDQTMSTRGVARGAATIMIMQRLDQDDPTAHLVAKGGYKHVVFPMRYEPGRADADPRDPRKARGELLWPELFPEVKVRQLEISLGQYGTAGQLQQRPAPEGGGIFKREWFRVIDALPLGPDGRPQTWRSVRGWDTASVEGGGDWTCGAKISQCGQTFVVEDVIRGQWGPGKVDDVLHSAATLDGKACRVREEKEGGSAGATVIAARRKRLVGFDYAGIPLSGSKVVRSGPFRAQCEGGNVLLLRGLWNEAYIEELINFPTGLHDDQVDASSAAFNELTGGPDPVKTRAVAWG